MERGRARPPVRPGSETVPVATLGRDSDQSARALRPAKVEHQPGRSAPPDHRREAEERRIPAPRRPAQRREPQRRPPGHVLHPAQRLRPCRSPHGRAAANPAGEQTDAASSPADSKPQSRASLLPAPQGPREALAGRRRFRGRPLALRTEHQGLEKTRVPVGPAPRDRLGPPPLCLVPHANTRSARLAVGPKAGRGHAGTMTTRR